MKKHILTIIFLIGIIVQSFAQSKTDSLQALLQTAQGENKIPLFEKLINIYVRSNPEKAITLSEELIELADSLKSLEDMALGYRLLADVYSRQQDADQSLKYWKENLDIEKRLNNRRNIAYSSMMVAASLQMLVRYDEALYHFGEAQKILEEIDDKKGLGYNFSNMGILYDKMGMTKESVGCKYKSLAIAELLADSGRIAQSLSSIAISQTKLLEHQKAIDNYSRAIAIYERIGNERIAVHSLANLGVVYNTLDQYEKSMECFNKGLALSEIFQYPYGRAVVEMNMGEILLELNQADSAMLLFEASNKTFKKLNVMHPLCYNYKVMGEYYLQVGENELAIQYMEKTFDLSREIQAPDMHRDAAFGLSEAYERSGQIDKALQAYKTFKFYSDSLFNSENVATLTRLEEQYLYEKESIKTDLLHQVELSKKQTIIISASIGLLVAVVLLILLFVEYRRKTAAYDVLYTKSMEQLKLSEKKRNREGLKNGELFEQIEYNMQNDHLYRIKELSQDMLADMMKTNRTYVSQTIIDHSDKKFREYVKEYRVKEAMEILADPKRSQVFSIESISEMVGFNSIATFNIAFKQFTGITPSQFRNHSGNK